MKSKPQSKKFNPTFWLKPINVHPKIGSSALDRFCYRWFYQSNERQVNPNIIPQQDDIDIIMREMTEINGFCVESMGVNDSGLAYTMLTIANIRPDIKENGVLAEISYKLLVVTRQYFQMTRKLDCSPFVEWVNSHQIILYIPVSIIGLRALENLQAEYTLWRRQQIARKASNERRLEEAVSRYRQNH